MTNECSDCQPLGSSGLELTFLGVAVYVIQPDTVHTVTAGLHMPGKKNTKVLQ